MRRQGCVRFNFVKEKRLKRKSIGACTRDVEAKLSGSLFHGSLYVCVCECVYNCMVRSVQSRTSRGNLQRLICIHYDVRSSPVRYSFIWRIDASTSKCTIKKVVTRTNKYNFTKYVQRVQCLTIAHNI